MKIEGRRPLDSPEIQLRTQKLGKTEQVAQTESPQNVQPTDQVNLSAQARELSELKKIIEQMPEVRTEKVEALKKAIAEGRYKIDALAIANKILEEQ